MPSLSFPRNQRACLLLFFGTAALLVILASLILLSTVFFPSLFTPKYSNDFCTTAACLAAGQRMANSLNTSVDPCEDFSAYACGGWLQSHPILPDQGQMSTYFWVGDQTVADLRRVFEEELHSSSSSSSSKAKSVRLALDLYRECVDIAARDRRGLEPLKLLLKEVLGSSEWPAANELMVEKTRLDYSAKNGMHRTLTRLAQLNVNPLVAFTVEKDANRSESMIINFIKPTFGLSQAEFTNVNGSFNAEVDLYRGQMNDFWHFFASSSSSSNKENIFPQQLNSRLEEVFALEKSLALAGGHAFDERATRNPSVWYKRLSLSRFNSDAGNDFLYYTTFLNDLSELSGQSPHRFSYNDIVIVKDLAYYQELARILAQTSSLTLYNYLAYKLAWQWSKHTDTRERQFRFKLKSAKEGVHSVTPLWKDCLLEWNDWAAARLYVQRYVQPETRQRASELAEDLRAAFTETVANELDWLDTATRTKALEKVSKMHFSMAYPDWLLNDTDLDLLKYGFTKDDPIIRIPMGHYFEGAVETVRRSEALKLRRLFQPPATSFERDIPFVPSLVNGMATNERNAVTITAAHLQSPFFEPTLPPYLNYAGVGAIIGHEITHNFDDEGAQYDAEGNLVNWWSEATKARFSEKTQCFVQQYESIVDRQTGVRLNGKRSLGENLADNGGVRQGLLALEARLKRQKGKRMQKLPQMEDFSPRQLFFLAYAHNWCEEYRTKFKKMALEQWAHMPGEYRINVPLRNLEQFSCAFHCPVGSKMNPIKKCRLW